MLSEPTLATRREDGRPTPLLYWRARRPLRAISSAPLGGGIGTRHWVLNATVPMSYQRNDPAAHLVELADQLDLRGPGVGLLTGVDVAEVVHRIDDGVRVWATVGLGTPIPAAAPTVATGTVPPAPAAGTVPAGATRLVPAARAAEAPTTGGAARTGSTERVGTVNIVAFLPVRLADAALVNAVATAAEAKAQAIWELGLPGTGTPTDTVTLLCPPDGPVAAYGGPRSEWGARLARAVHAAVLTGGADPVVPWSEQPGWHDQPSHDRSPHDLDQPGGADRPLGERSRADRPSGERSDRGGAGDRAVGEAAANG